MNATSSLIDKYNVPVPRYTSYPTVPVWVDKEHLEESIPVISKRLLDDGISIYIHLPFCESLCTYCGCNKRITKNHSVETKYIDSLLKEWKMYINLLGDNIILKELHLGGGTPTFFSPENLTYLIRELYKSVILHPEFEASFEGHPNNTTREHLQALYDIGFRRVSFGVQDLDIKVQTAIHRIQPHEKVTEVTRLARAIGYSSVNFDLIYGLPFQTQETIINTFEKVIELQPDRIAFYSYAHVPWVSKSQRAYNENDLPSGLEKRKLYEKGCDLLIAAGYEDIGMDHFSLKSDSLYIAQQRKQLHRNFMGYTTNNTKISVGLGVSSISDFYSGYRQNVKTIEEYYDILEQGRLPVVKGIDLKRQDLIQRRHILDITCNLETMTTEEDFAEMDIEYFEMLREDELVEMKGNVLAITETGKSFVRNIAALFDPSYHFFDEKIQQKYSQSV